MQDFLEPQQLQQVFLFLRLWQRLSLQLLLFLL
jgi:hypothetical protein